MIGYFSPLLSNKLGQAPVDSAFLIAVCLNAALIYRDGRGRRSVSSGEPSSRWNVPRSTVAGAGWWEARAERSVQLDPLTDQSVRLRSQLLIGPLHGR